MGGRRDGWRYERREAGVSGAWKGSHSARSVCVCVEGQRSVFLDSKGSTQAVVIYNVRKAVKCQILTVA